MPAFQDTAGFFSLNGRLCVPGCPVCSKHHAMQLGLPPMLALRRSDRPGWASGGSTHPAAEQPRETIHSAEQRFTSQYVTRKKGKQPLLPPDSTRRQRNTPRRCSHPCESRWMCGRAWLALVHSSSGVAMGVGVGVRTDLTVGVGVTSDVGIGDGSTVGVGGRGGVVSQRRALSKVKSFTR